MSEMPEPRERRSNTALIIILAAAVLLLLACCCVATVLFARSRFDGPGRFGFDFNFPGTIIERGINVAGDRVEEVTTRERTFENVTTPLTLRVDNKVGRIEVRGADTDTVRISATVKTYGDSQSEASRRQDQVTVNMEQPSNAEVVITATYPNSLSEGRSPVVDLVIEVPTEADVDLQTDVGEIVVRDLVGAAEIASNVGDVTVRELQGTLQLQTNVGSTTVQSFTMEGSSSVTGRVGDVTVELVGDPAFTLDAETNVGDIDSEFDVDGERDNDIGPGDRLEGTVGDNPTMELTLRTNTGSIRLERGR